jgi:hypothetical protein
LTKYIFDQAVAKNIGFIYLSSLSVFGSVKDDIVTLNSNRCPIDTYGKTKNKFDDYVNSISSEKNVRVGAILPASIHTGKGRSSVEKFDQLMSKLPFLKFFALPGTLSYIKRDVLINMIVHSVLNEQYENIIASDSYRLSKFANKYSIKIPKMFKFFFPIIDNVIGKHRSLVLRMLLRGIEYK